MESWTERPNIINNLLNPAFCGEILQNAGKEYSLISRKEMPYALSFLVIPLILHKPTRDSLPRTKRKHFYSWIEETGHLRLDFPERIKSYVPYTKEALVFLMHRKLIAISESGGILTKTFGQKYEGNNEICEIMKKSGLLGKLLANSGTVQSTYSILGIKP